MNYGMGNVKAKKGGGDAELNIAYGLTPPNDTSKIWVRTDKTPTSVEITTEPTWSDVITSEIISEEMISTMGLIKMVRAGEYLYLIGGIDNAVNKDTSLIRRYNPYTSELETIDVKLPYGLRNFALCCYKDYIYIFFGQSKVGNDLYYQSNVIRFNWKTNEVFAITKNIYDNYPNTVYYRASKHAYVLGDKAYIMYGGAAYLPTTDINYVKNAGSVSSDGGGVEIFDLEKEEWETFKTGASPLLNSGGMATETIDKIPIVVGGYWNSYLGFANLNITKNTTITKKDELTIGDSYYIKSIDLYCSMPIILTTNNGLYVMGGAQGTQNNVSATTTIKYFNYSADSVTTKTETLPLANYWNSCQYDEQTSYGTSGKYLIKVENKILLEENKLMIIPDMYGKVEYDITKEVDGMAKTTTIQSVYIGDSNGKAERVRCYKYENGSWKGIGCDDYIPQTKKNVEMGNTWLDTTNTSLTSNILCNVGDLIIASVIARDSGNESVSSGWTLLGRSQVGALNQTLAFYYKIATNELETITITQSASARIYISMCNFTGKTNATMGEFFINSGEHSCDFTLPNKLCLVGGSFNIWSNTAPYLPWYYNNPNDSNFKDYQQVIVSNYQQQRLGTWLDYGGGGQRSVGVDGLVSTTNDAIVGYVTIE